MPTEILYFFVIKHSVDMEETKCFYLNVFDKKSLSTSQKHIISFIKAQFSLSVHLST
jgi:hypothetical protein